MDIFHKKNLEHMSPKYESTRYYYIYGPSYMFWFFQVADVATRFEQQAWRPLCSGMSNVWSDLHIFLAWMKDCHLKVQEGVVIGHTATKWPPCLLYKPSGHISNLKEQSKHFASHTSNVNWQCTSFTSGLFIVLSFKRLH